MTADLAALLDTLEARLAHEAGMSSCFSLTPAQATALVKVAKAAGAAVGPSACDRGPDGACQFECGEAYAGCLRRELFEALAALREQLDA